MQCYSLSLLDSLHEGEIHGIPYVAREGDNFDCYVIYRLVVHVSYLIGSYVKKQVAILRINFIP